MTIYRNGYIPRAALICIATGTNGDGYWEHLLSPSQLAKHNALVARARNRTGRTLRITTGWCAYRPYAAQVTAKQKYGRDAAAPGYSSHGGTYNNRDAMAMDYGNWESVYSGYGGQTAFYQDCRAVGLTPGVIAREAWHVIDYDPWAAVPSGDVGKPAAQPAPLTLEDLMAFKNITLATQVKSGVDAYNSTSFDFEDGMKSKLAETALTYTNNTAKWLTGQTAMIVTQSHYESLTKEFDDFWAAKRAHELEVARAGAGPA